MLDEATVTSLLAAAGGGDPAAVDSLIREFRPRIFRYVLARLGDESASEDITQETCIAVVKALPSFESRGVRFSSFVFAVANNKIVDSWRAAGRAPRTTTDEVLRDRPEAAPGPEDLAVLASEVRRLVEPLARLSERERNIILMRVVAQLSAEEVGEALEMSPGAVRVTQHRALKALRNHLGKEGS